MRQELESLRPKTHNLVYQLVKEAGVDVADWANSKRGQRGAASNPRYCYNWSFVEPNKVAVLNLWFEHMKESAGEIFQTIDYRQYGQSLIHDHSYSARYKRAKHLDEAVAAAYFDELPVRVIVCSGVRKEEGNPDAQKSRVEFRWLDDVAWAVTEYDDATGVGRLVRGAKPVSPTFNGIPVALEMGDELAAFEGQSLVAMREYRFREWKFRQRYLDERRHAGARLVCDVVGCGFDFEKVYGELGKDFMEVHHRFQLGKAPKAGRKYTASDLAIVCSNCHRMIHRNGQCRDVETLLKQDNH